MAPVKKSSQQSRFDTMSKVSCASCCPPWMVNFKNGVVRLSVCLSVCLSPSVSLSLNLFLRYCGGLTYYFGVCSNFVLSSP